MNKMEIEVKDYKIYEKALDEERLTIIAEIESLDQLDLVTKDLDCFIVTYRPNDCPYKILVPTVKVGYKKDNNEELV